MARMIISYRRSDSAAIAGRIFDRLVAQYGEDAVFMDIDNIPFGIDFRDHIQSIMTEATLVLAVVGPRWLGQGAGSGGRDRIADMTDPVRVEIETALKKKITIIPILVDGAQMPDAESLPEPIRQLAFINAAPVDTARDFRAHVDRLIRSIDRLVAPSPVVAPPLAPPATIASMAKRRRRPSLALIVLCAIVFSAAGVYLALMLRGTNSLPDAVPANEVTAQPTPPPQTSSVGSSPDATPPPPTASSNSHPPTAGADDFPQQRPHDYSVLATVSEGKLNMRSGPGATYPLITAIPAGATALRVGTCTMPDDGGTKPWCEAKWNHHRGWISSCCIVDEVTGGPPQ